MTEKPQLPASPDFDRALSPGMMALHDALNATTALYEVPDAASGRPEFPTSLPWLNVEAVISAIKNVPEVYSITQLHQLSLGASTGVRIFPQILASGLMRRAHELGDAKEAVSELLDLVQTDRASSRLTLVLAGVKVESATDVAPGVVLQPFSDVKPPPWDKHLEDTSRWPLSKNLEPVGPSAALVATTSFSPVFTAVDRVPDRYPEPEIEHLRIIGRCIALAADGPVATLLLWCEDDDPRLPFPTGGVTFHE